MQFTNPIGNHSLVGHVITSAPVESEIGCEARCFADDDCMSVNLGPLEGSKYLCELSSSDHNLHPKDLKYKKGFVYKPAWVSVTRWKTFTDELDKTSLVCVTLETHCSIAKAT